MLRNLCLLAGLTAKNSSNSNLQFRSSICRLFAYQPWLPIPQLHPTPKIPNSNNPNPNHNFSKTDFTAIYDLLRNPKILHGSDLESALQETKILPSPPLLEAVIDHFESSPKLLFSLFKWAEKQPGFEPSTKLFNSMINLLGKAREFDSAWTMVLEKIEGDSGSKLASFDCFAILIRRYARANMVLPAIRTLEFANSLNLNIPGNVETSLFEILLDSLSKEGHVSVASEYLDRRMKSEPNWIPSTKVYNILLNGWFRMRKMKKVEKLWMQMRKENVMPTVVTYGTLIEGFCRMSRIERAIELISEMKKDGIEPNAVVFNPIVDALAESGKFKEALGMLERFSVLESGPNLSTYNSLVKGFCKNGDLVGASKILKTMISRHILPTATTYNYFFRYFSKHDMIQEGMSLYTKMIDSGYDPDRLTFHLMLKLLCEGEKLDWAVQVSQEMRIRGFDMDLASSTMLLHLFCKMKKWNEAFAAFEEMICRGIVPQYLTFERMKKELTKNKKFQMAQALSKLMASVPHSTNLPNTYVEEEKDSPHLRRKAILQKAKAMSNALRTCKDPSKLVKRERPENDVECANRLIEEFNSRIART
ncbi:hypothetical protein V2J09_005396 [Rumex salicifolius]